MPEQVQIERAGDIVTLTLSNNPERMNPFNWVMRDELVEAFTALHSDDTCRAIILTAAGSHFSAGADLKGGAGPGFPTRGSQVREQHRRLPSGMRRVWDEMEGIEKPFVVAHHARCVGGSLEMSLSCDFRLAAARTACAACGTRWSTSRSPSSSRTTRAASAAASR